MFRLYKIAFITILAIFTNTAFANETTPVKPLIIGVTPYLSARALVTSYEPMRLYLENVLGKPVKIYSANGFKQYFERAVKGDYDLVISAAHFARLLQKEHKFTPLVRYSKGGRGLVMASVNGPLNTPNDLRGQVIAVPEQLALATIVCMIALNENGLKAGTDFKILEVPSFTSAILAIQNGDATAAVSAPAALAQMPQELRESVKPVLDTGEYINLIFLAHPRLDKTFVALLNKALLKFGSESSEGKQFFASNSSGTTIPATEKDMNSLDRYIAETKRLLNATP